MKQDVPQPEKKLNYSRERRIRAEGARGWMYLVYEQIVSLNIINQIKKCHKGHAQSPSSTMISKTTKENEIPTFQPSCRHWAHCCPTHHPTLLRHPSIRGMGTIFSRESGVAKGRVH